MISAIFDPMFSMRAIKVIGVKAYLRTILQCARNIRYIRDPEALFYKACEGMTDIYRVRYSRDNEFLFDGNCDRLRPNVKHSTAFSMIRELYIKDCYFKYQPVSARSNLETVLDLGSNRGTFSLMVARHASRVIAVEAQAVFLPIIDHHIALNQFTNIEVVHAAVGESGLSSPHNYNTIQDFMAELDINHISFLKMDIEGAEYSLFARPDWLEKTAYISMELHPDHHPSYRNAVVFEALRQHGFEFVTTTTMFKPVTETYTGPFLCTAWKASENQCR